MNTVLPLKNKITSLNTGISILRLFMSFVVILTHFGTEKATFFKYFGESAVPCFMFISFFLISGALEKPNAEQLRRRFMRLLSPLVFWTLVYYTLMSLRHGELLDFRQVIYSFLFGSARLLNPPLWFLSAQLYITVFMFVVCFVLRDERRLAAFMLGAILAAYALEYSGANYYLFGTAAYEVSFTLGRIAEVLPFAITGFLFGKYRDSFSARQLLLLCAGLAAAAIGCSFMPVPPGFGYQGLVLLPWSLLICLVFISLPQLGSSTAAHRLNSLAQYTLGIYCIHYAAGQLLEGISSRFGVSLFQGSLLFDLMIWILSLAAAMTMGFLAKKIKFLKYTVM